MASKIEVKDLLEAGVHFGHLTRKWNPNMAPYIYMERNGIHVINLYKTVAKLEEANEALKKIAASGRKILFVATKKQAKDIVADKVSKVNMPYITERWPGGMLTNFVTIRKAVKKMASIDRMKKDGTFNTLSKKERLQVDRLRAKLDKNLGSIADMTRLPGALFIVDTMREHIAVKEAQKLNIPIFAMVDTNSDPRDVDYAIPSNDDAGKSIEAILESVTSAVAEGLEERKSEKGSGKDKDEDAPKKEKKSSEEKSAKKAEAAPKKEAKADDLTKIEGIGPKAAEALVESGITTYAELAKADADDIKETLTEASSTLAHLDPTSWPKQAKMAADGEWDELKEWQDSVKGGVE
ncbi:MAG TPA: 30S ribosomal protein S2 [Muricauda sp.]|uniref:Small ribosomal subunit protein uS2 n=1 Tax=Flagellimonas aurea TaxID=2915619 RepID=A0ABS3G6C8_9FLAO|nr:30S ribosomal protein S2 [Allomuricauda aurea]MAO17453.1 30S ribosomal protein S2 [Allomuricauda sp.]MBC73123.1 30S ribosomal protein S2 [Allomuricauda sp.]MBO0354982.1 30S ribosomal protein S2 [Allomuricauda aurea]HBU78343.1 30S ribosomal protein S2 [Allomuricauda sp.]|tara:strand:- start:764 stop:1819 length:1056 start_codon:yes stop_codon:yes gene_type:complete